MEEGADSGGDALYAIELGRRPPASLRSRFPSMRVHITGAQTALRREVSDSRQLGALLQDVQSVGLVLTEAHRLTTLADDLADEASGDNPTPAQTPATYEVRVAGVLGTPLLRYLSCSYFVLPERVMVRLAVDLAGLTSFVKACSECSARVERVRRISPVLARA